ncbi:iron ABC transporter permease [Treponema sp. OMZ 840]|uniref:ABC transporter permease n=1 Tax=Treponema sp. OMZ 840 TaxID=244313 RepID=UPI003D8AD92D
MQIDKIKSIRIKWDIWTLSTIICLLFFTLFMVYPLLQIFRLSVINDGIFSFKYFNKFLEKKYYVSALTNSLLVAFSATFTTVIIGTVLAYITHTMKIYGKKFLEIIIIITMLSPPFIGAYSWILLLGRNGVITNFVKNTSGIILPSIYGFHGMLTVFSLQLYPLIYLYVSGALKNINKSLLEASESFGCIGIRRFFKVILPLLMPMILSGAVLVFMRSMADFGTPQLIGKGYRTMPYLIYNEFISEVGGNDGFAAALSVIMVIITLIFFLLQKYISRKMSYTMNANKSMEAIQHSGLKNIAAHIFVYIIVFLGLLPQLTVTYTAFRKTSTSGRMFIPGYSLTSFHIAFKKLGNCLVNTYVFSIVAVLMIVLIGVFVAYLAVRRASVITHLLDTMTMVSYIIPGSIMGIALLLGFNRKPFMLVGSVFIMLLAYVLRRIPYTIRSSAAILTNIHPSVEEAAISLGASNIKTFGYIVLPMMFPGVLSGAILSWMTIISELSATILLYVKKTETLTIAIYTEVVRSNYGTAAALSVILALSTVTVLLLFFKLSKNSEIKI